MSVAEIFGIVLVAGCGLFGLLGTFIPFIPDLPLIWVGMFAYGLLTRFSELSFPFLLLLAGLAAVGLIVDFAGQAIGAKRYGARPAGVIGAIIGFVFGLSLFGPIGIILGPFLGAVVGEMLTGRSRDEAARAGIGALVGFLGSTIVKFAIGLTMLGLFFARIF